MIKIVSVTAEGEITLVATSMGEPAEGQHAVPLDSPITPQTHYYDGSDFIEFPPKPSRLHVFDYALKEWADPRSAAEVTLAQIAAVELTITPRRMREAALGTDGGWLAVADAEISALRGSLT